MLVRLPVATCCSNKSEVAFTNEEPPTALQALTSAFCPVMESYIYSVTQEFFEFALSLSFILFSKCVLLLHILPHRIQQVLFQTIYFLASVVGDLS